MQKSKKMMIFLGVVLMGIIMSCSNHGPAEVISVKCGYTKIVDNYGYLRIDTIVTFKANVWDREKEKAEENKFVDKSYTVNYSTTFLLMKTNETIETCPTLPYPLLNKVKKGKELRREYYSYKITASVDYESDYGFFVKYEGVNLLGSAYVKTFDGFICFRSTATSKNTFIVRLGEDKIFKTLVNTEGCFEDIENDMYPYYFFDGHESLMILKKMTLDCVATVPNTHLDQPCDDNAQFLFLSRNDDSGYVLYDIKKLAIITDKRSNEQSNICLLYTSPSPRDRQKSRMPSSA